MPTSKKKNASSEKTGPLTSDEKHQLELQVEKEYNTNNSDQFRQIKQLSVIFKSIIEHTGNKKLKIKCTDGLQILRDFSKHKRENPCSQKKMSERLRNLYQKISKFVKKELHEFEEDELENVDDVISVWYGFMITAQNIRSRHESRDEVKELEDEKFRKAGEETTRLNYSRMRLTELHFLLQRLKQERTQDPYLAI